MPMLATAKASDAIVKMLRARRRVRSLIDLRWSADTIAARLSGARRARRES